VQGLGHACLDRQFAVAVFSHWIVPFRSVLGI
jgi:hypothetical protein